MPVAPELLPDANLLSLFPSSALQPLPSASPRERPRLTSLAIQTGMQIDDVALLDLLGCCAVALFKGIHQGMMRVAFTGSV